MKFILGISAYYHDSAAALIKDGDIIAAAQEERFTRKKNTANFPKEAIKYCLREAGISIGEVDSVVFYDKPFLKFERLLETYYAFSPRGLRSFIKAIPVWLDQKLFTRRNILRALSTLDGFDKKKIHLLFSSHHLSHAASAYFPSPFTDSAILTIDGVGEWSTACIGIGKENTIEIKKELRFPHSVGLLYSAFTYYLGFKVNSGEYKLMGLAPYGDPDSPETANFIQLIRENMVDIKQDGSIFLHQEYFNYATGLRMTNDAKWQAMLSVKRRAEEDPITQQHCNLAHAIQRVTEEIVLIMAKEAKRVTGSDNLCLAGGVALNCVANGKLENSGIFTHIFVQPAAGDAGGALGAALSVYHQYHALPRVIQSPDGMKGSYLGPSLTNEDIAELKTQFGAEYGMVEEEDLLCQKVATLIAEGNVVGWFQGRMEFGPRALGNRSILADPRDPEMQRKLNLKIKFRESFRPFAPAVLEEDVSELFETVHINPYMTSTALIREKWRKNSDSNPYETPIAHRVGVDRSILPAITHLDFSARIQSVSKQSNPRFRKLLLAFKSMSGFGVLINTSFNVRGEPIVSTTADAYRCFMATDMDYLVIGNAVFTKKLQPHYEQKERWAQPFEVD